MNQVAIQLAPPTWVPCPDWCENAAGHGYEWRPHDGLDSRVHSLTFHPGEDTFAAIATEAVFTSGGELLNAEPWVEVWVGGNPIDAIPNGSERMSARQARVLGRALLEAADKLELITEAVSD